MGFVGNPDPELVNALILKVRRRGPDSFGIAWMTAKGDRGIERRPTPSWPAPFRVELPRNLAWGVGHARLTTSGRGIDNAQPLRIGDMVFAHNGVYGHEELAAAYHLPLETGNDSEVLGRLFIRFNYHAAATMDFLATYEKKVTPHSFIAALPTRMWVVAWGQPIHILELAGVRYFQAGLSPPATCCRLETSSAGSMEVFNDAASSCAATSLKNRTFR